MVDKLLVQPADYTPTNPLDLDAARRRNNFDILRFVLAAFVVVSHSYALGVGHERDEPLARIAHHQATLGHLAVDGFFIISGFLITLSFERAKGLWDYFKKRIFRIYPGFIVANSIGIYIVTLAALPADAAYPGVSFLKFALNSMRLETIPVPRVFEDNAHPAAINGSLWSIPYEFWCYVGVAVLGILGLLVRRWAVVGLFIMSLITAGVFAERDLTWFRGGPFTAIFGQPHLWARLLPFYLAGVVAYRFRHRIHSRDLYALIALLALAATSFVPNSWSVMLPTAGAYLVFWIAFHDRIRFPNFARFGDFSYGMYLYAFPIQQLIVHWAGGSMAPMRLMALSLPASILAGIVSWFAVERWFLARTRRGHSTVSAKPS